MVPHRGLEHRQHLLPYEQQICDAIGISEEEYFDYFELVQQAKRARGQDYAHIPDVVNEPISLTTVLVNLAVGVALTAVSMLLAPKPKSPSEQKKRPNFDGSNIRGRTRYAPLTNFDAVQDLAVLGSSVPLIYTNRRPEQDDPEPGEDRARRIVGGVRVESQLLWSQLRNRHKHQELKTALLFSAGYIPTPPDLEGYALGDSILQDYTNSKVRLIFKPGGNAQGPAVANKAKTLPTTTISTTALITKDLTLRMAFTSRLTPLLEASTNGCTAPLVCLAPAQRLVHTTQCPTATDISFNLSGLAKATVKIATQGFQFLPNVLKAIAVTCLTVAVWKS